jgi:hypothetical protein
MNLYTVDIIFSNAECSNCITNANINDILNGEMCRNCWINNGLAYGRCVPMPESGLTFYGADISNGIVDTASWTSNNKI